MLTNTWRNGFSTLVPHGDGHQDRAQARARDPVPGAPARGPGPGPKAQDLIVYGSTNLTKGLPVGAFVTGSSDPIISQGSNACCVINVVFVQLQHHDKVDRLCLGVGKIKVFKFFENQYFHTAVVQIIRLSILENYLIFQIKK